MKKLDPVTKRNVKQWNQARKAVDLPLIEIKVRKCLLCAQNFESAGNRTCGCSVEELLKCF